MPINWWFKITVCNILRVVRPGSFSFFLFFLLCFWFWIHTAGAPIPLGIFFFFFWFGIYTASVPSTAGTSTGGDAVLGKPESSPARRHSRNSCHMFVCIVVCACSRHALDFEILLFRSFVTRKGYCMATSRRSESILLRDCVCCIVLLTRFWGIVTVPGSSLFRGPVTWVHVGATVN